MAEKTTDEYLADIHRLADKIGEYRPDIIMPCMRGGLFPGMVLSYLLGVKDVIPIDIRREGDRRWLRYEVQGDITDASILIVEDDLRTGLGPAYVKKRFLREGAKEVRIAAVYVTPEGRKVTDYWVE